ncbi:MAG: Crp/Fnr family transcriptional regulator, partial [Eubacterium sp.]|nr:Crp/Fnr family transcriptional regulator [Eubacterium sp.]
MEAKYTDPLQDQYHILRNRRNRQRLEKLGTLKHFKKNHIFDYREQVPDGFFMIKSGRVIVYEDSYEGEHRVYNVMRSGSLILEEYALFPKPCPVLFKTLVDSDLIQINRCDLIRAMKSDIDIVLDLLESVCGKFVSSMETQRIGTRQNAEWKVCRMIISDIENYGRPYEGGMIVKEKI